MKASAREISNKPMLISKAGIEEYRVKRLGDLHRSLVNLYNLGVLKSPSGYSNKEISGTLGTDLINPMTSQLLGDFYYTPLMLEYAVRCSTDEPAMKDWQIVVDAAKDIEDCNTVIKKTQMFKSKDEGRAKVAVTVASSIRGSRSFPFDNPNLGKFLVVEHGHHIESVALNRARYDYLVKMLDLQEQDGEALFLGKGFTYEDDIKFLPLLYKGEVQGKGIGGVKLSEYMSTYYTDYFNKRTDSVECQRFHDRLFLDTIGVCTDLLEEFRQAHEGCSALYITDDFVLFQVRGIPEPEPFNRDFHIGSYLRDDENADVCIYERLHGLGGEFIPSVTAYKLGLQTGDRRPLMLTDQSSFYECYPVQWLTYEDGSPVPPYVLSYEDYEHDIVEVCERLEIDRLEDIADEVADAIDCKYKGYVYGFRKLVGVLVMTLFCVECNYTLEGHDSPSHVVLGDEFCFVDDEIFNQACYYAENVFKKL